MAFGMTGDERAALDSHARAILAACPNVGSFIRRGLSGDHERETLVYLRTALDPAPVVTRAGEFWACSKPLASGSGATASDPATSSPSSAPNVTATSIAYWAAMSSAVVQPLNLLFSRDAIAAQLAAVKAKVLFAPPPGAPGGLHEKLEGIAARGAERRTDRRPADGRTRRLRRRDACSRPPAREPRNAPAPTRSPRSCRPAARPASPRSCRSPIATSSPRRLPRCSPLDLRPEDRFLHSAAAFPRRRRLLLEPRLRSASAQR